eukprot:2121579-Prymnesium_polylepis.1
MWLYPKLLAWSNSNASTPAVSPGGSAEMTDANRQYCSDTMARSHLQSCPGHTRKLDSVVRPGTQSTDQTQNRATGGHQNLATSSTQCLQPSSVAWIDLPAPSGAKSRMPKSWPVTGNELKPMIMQSPAVSGGSGGAPGGDGHNGGDGGAGGGSGCKVKLWRMGISVE